MPSFAAAALGVDPVKIVTDGTGGDALGQQLQQQLTDQEDERKKKLMKIGGTVGLAAQALLGNSGGGFGG